MGYQDTIVAATVPLSITISIIAYIWKSNKTTVL